MCKVKAVTLSGFKRKIIPKLVLPSAKTQKLAETSSPSSTVEEKKKEQPEVINEENVIVISGSTQPLTKINTPQKPVLTEEQKQQRIDTLLIKATQLGHVEKVKDLIENHKANINATSVGTSVLHYAVFYNRPEIVNYLMECGVDFNFVNHSGNTALACAVEKGNTDIAWILLDQADPSIPDKLSLTPLHKAVKMDNFAMVETLLSINTDGEWTKVNAVTTDGFTPLYLAASKGNVEIVKLLHEWKANLNIPSKALNTPLQRAIFGNHVAVATYLVDNGADVDYKDVAGRTALDIAIYNGFDALVKLLLDHNAKFDPTSAITASMIKRASVKGFKACLDLLTPPLSI